MYESILAEYFIQTGAANVSGPPRHLLSSGGRKNVLASDSVFYLRNRCRRFQFAGEISKLGELLSPGRRTGRSRNQTSKRCTIIDTANQSDLPVEGRGKTFRRNDRRQWRYLKWRVSTSDGLACVRRWAPPVAGVCAKRQLNSGIHFARRVYARALADCPRVCAAGRPSFSK